ncbi:unnamed protein product [Meloidogyne enterolobii]|uniref:Uncharacterized protein n=1 Tax=Meloidogyne enterolobii TaxID=390850 RepID=A0ACB1B1L6_MELEN
MDSFIYTILMFRQCIMLEDFFELLMALCGQKCAKLFSSHEQLLEFVKERCKTRVKIEEKGSRVFLSWAEPNDVSKRLHDQLVIIGKRVCSESAPQKG